MGDKKDKFLIVVIDFGIIFFGYVFLFKYDYKIDFLKIFIN